MPDDLKRIQSRLNSGLRLRTACDLEVKNDPGIVVRRPTSFVVPTLSDLGNALPVLIASVARKQQWPENRSTIVNWEPAAKAKKATTTDDTTAAN